MLWSVVVPVKLLAHAKSRLAEFAGAHRERLALAVATDTVSAALACPRVRTVLVVTDDAVAAPILAEAGARVVSDKPNSGLNPALAHGAVVAAATHPDAGVAALSADLPALRAEELGRVLEAAVTARTSFLPDATGTGTTLYAATPGAAFDSRFGPGSRDTHLAAGVYELLPEGIGSVRRDVDTPADLREAMQLGVGPHTARITALLRPAERL